MARGHMRLMLGLPLAALLAVLRPSVVGVNFATLPFQLRRARGGTASSSFAAVRSTPQVLFPERCACSSTGLAGAFAGTVAAYMCFRKSRAVHGPTASRRAQSFLPRAACNLDGTWGCVKTEGDIDAYWKACGLPWLARKGLQLMDWGAGKNQNVRKFSQQDDDITMEYSFTGPGLGGLGFTENYVVGKGVQEIKRMGGATILVDPVWDGDALRITNSSPAKQTQGWAKSLMGGATDEVAAEAAAKDDPLKALEGGEKIDVHKFYMDGDSTLVLEADASPSGGPTVKWFLTKLS